MHNQTRLKTRAVFDRIKEEREVEGLTLAPAINSKSHTIERDVSDLYDWQAARLRKQEFERREKERQEQREFAQLQSKNFVGRRTRELTRKRENIPVEDRLAIEGARVK